VIKVYFSPADPTLPNPPQDVASYAANAMAFEYGSKTSRIMDGTSNTIAYVEHYALCGETRFGWYEDAIDRIPFLDASGTSAFRRATFADRALGDVYPLGVAGQPRSQASVTGMTFQAQPLRSNCNPRVPQTPHRGGMLAAMLDGRVRTISPGVSESSFWGAVTPQGGEVLGNDF
jgi:hypothetical protein